MNEIASTESFIYAQLTGDSQLSELVGDRVYSYSVPAGKVFPVVLFGYLAGADTQGNGSHRQMTRLRYQIKAVGRGNMTAELIQIANRIDELFQNFKMAPDGSGATFSSRREQPISYQEQGGESETKFRHLGGIYRINCY